MNWGVLAFLSNPWFVVPWYAVGLIGSLSWQGWASEWDSSHPWLSASSPDPIFQYKAMSKMTESVMKALWMGGRAGFFSMITVMNQPNANPTAYSNQNSCQKHADQAGDHHRRHDPRSVTGHAMNHPPRDLFKHGLYVLVMRLLLLFSVLFAIGFLTTYPMNWILVKMQWKHGMA